MNLRSTQILVYVLNFRTLNYWSYNIRWQNLQLCEWCQYQLKLRYLVKLNSKNYSIQIESNNYMCMPSVIIIVMNILFSPSLANIGESIRLYFWNSLVLNLKIVNLSAVNLKLKCTGYYRLKSIDWILIFWFVMIVLKY